jgi:hypothetical protein
MLIASFYIHTTLLLSSILAYFLSYSLRIFEVRLTYFILILPYILAGQSRWPRGLRRGSTSAFFSGLRVQITPGAWMSDSCECRLLLRKELCLGLINRPDWSYRVWRV